MEKDDSAEKNETFLDIISKHANFGISLLSLLELKALCEKTGNELVLQNIQGFNRVNESSPYEQLQETPFETRDTRFEPSMTTWYVERSEAYPLLKTVVKPDKLEALIAGIERKYPQEIWGENLPELELLQYLFNEQYEAFLQAH